MSGDRDQGDPGGGPSPGGGCRGPRNGAWGSGCSGAAEPFPPRRVPVRLPPPTRSLPWRPGGGQGLSPLPWGLPKSVGVPLIPLPPPGVREQEPLHPSVGCWELPLAPSRVVSVGVRVPPPRGGGGAAHQPFPTPPARPAPSPRHQLPAMLRAGVCPCCAPLRRDMCPVALSLALGGVPGAGRPSHQDLLCLRLAHRCRGRGCRCHAMLRW